MRIVTLPSFLAEALNIVCSKLHKELLGPAVCQDHVLVGDVLRDGSACRVAGSRAWTLAGAWYGVTAQL